MQDGADIVHAEFHLFHQHILSLFHETFPLALVVIRIFNLYVVTSSSAKCDPSG